MEVNYIKKVRLYHLFMSSSHLFIKFYQTVIIKMLINDSKIELENIFKGLCCFFMVKKEFQKKCYLTTSTYKIKIQKLNGFKK